MDGDVGTEIVPLLGNGHASVQGIAKVFFRDRSHQTLDMLVERLADLDLLAVNR